MSTMRDLKAPTVPLVKSDTAVYVGSLSALHGQRVEVVTVADDERYIVALLNADGSAVTDHRGEQRLLKGVHTESLLVPLTEDEVRSATAKRLFAVGYCVCGEHHPVIPATEHDEAALDCPVYDCLIWEHDLIAHLTKIGA